MNETSASGLIQYDVIALSELEDERYEVLRDAVHDSLKRFTCDRSEHLQSFARESVHRYERHGHSKTYVFITPVGTSGIDVPAFFTVGMTTLDLSKASRSQRKRFNGDVSLTTTGAYSIAELARSDRYSAEQLPGSLILDEAKRVILLARQHVGGRFAVVDARQEVFEALYQPGGFKQVHTAEAPMGMEGVKFSTSACLIKDWPALPG